MRRSFVRRLDGCKEGYARCFFGIRRTYRYPSRVRQSLFYVFLLALVVPAFVEADSNAICTWDEALSSAAAALVSKAERPDTDALVQAVRDAGSAAVGLRAIWVSNDDQRPVDLWLQKIGVNSDAPLACGDARNESGRLVIAEARAGSLAAIDQTSTRIAGWLIATFSHPELVISYKNGEIHRYSIDRKSLENGVSFATEPIRPVHVQLVARGPAGPRPIAERVIPPAASAPKLARAKQKASRVSWSKTIEVDQSSTGDRVEHTLWVRLRKLRRTRGVSEVRANRLIKSVAARHAQGVCETGRAVHELEPGDDPEVRLARQGVRARMVGETIARSISPDAAFTALTKSPAHISTLLDPRYTDAGVGLATDSSGKSCLVIVLAAWPRFVGR